MNFPVRSGTNVSNSENKETSKWSLQLPTSNAPLWTGPRTSCPNLQELSTSLSATSLTDADLAELAAQTVRSAPTNAILAVLPALACNFWRDSSSMIDPKMLQKLPSANPRFVCGVVFKKGDIVWTCKQCAKDSTCVQCDACFSASDHEGHEVYFHRSSGRGGCCDCGDPEAWAPSGNCSKHSHAGKVSADPTSAVPAELKRGFKAVVEAVVGVIASYSTSIVRGFQNKQDNCFLSLVNENLAVRLHNDDVHTYAEVIHALTSFGLNRQRANILTTEVDQNGYALVGIASSNADSILSRATDILSSRAGLLLSITPEKIVNMEQNIVMAFSWLLSFGNTHDGLARIVAEAFSKELTLLPTCASAGKDVLAPSPVDIFPLQEQEQEQAQVSGDGDIRAKLGFPSEIQHLKRGLPSHVLADTEMTELLLHPFDRCPRNAISLLVAASPYLSPPMCKAINDLVIIYQQDAHFKVVFSQVSTKKSFYSNYSVQ